MTPKKLKRLENIQRRYARKAQILWDRMSIEIGGDKPWRTEEWRKHRLQKKYRLYSENSKTLLRKIFEVLYPAPIRRFPRPHRFPR